MRGRELMKTRRKSSRPTRAYATARVEDKVEKTASGTVSPSCCHQLEAALPKLKPVTISDGSGRSVVRLQEEMALTLDVGSIPSHAMDQDSLMWTRGRFLLLLS